MKGLRLDTALVQQNLCTTRSQAVSDISLGKILVNGVVATKPAQQVFPTDTLVFTGERYVSRAGQKLASVARYFGLDFKDKVVLDVGSSTGGFTDYVLQHGAKKVIAVDVGTNQLHPRLRTDERVELHEQTDIRDFVKGLTLHIDTVVVDVSFISLRDVLPSISKVVSPNSCIVAMCKPQFESGDTLKHKGVIKNDAQRRKILKDFEMWARKYFVLVEKADSKVAGSKGNVERFYLMKVLK